MKTKFIWKYMRIARQIALDNTACYSRQIGSVIAKEEGGTSRILGTGYNGAPPGVPHPDSREFLAEYFWPMMNAAEQLKSIEDMIPKDRIIPDDRVPAFFDRLQCTIQHNLSQAEMLELFLNKYAHKKLCPRRIVGAGPGIRPEGCHCIHSERAAITNATQSCVGAEMFCWCGIPCTQCAGTIVQAGIKDVHCLHKDPYLGVHGSLFIFKYAKVTVHTYDPACFDGDMNNWELRPVEVY